MKAFSRSIYPSSLYIVSIFYCQYFSWAAFFILYLRTSVNQALEGGIKLLHSAVSSARPHYIRLCEAVRQTTQVLPTTGFSSESIEPLLQALQACDEQLMRVMQASRQSLPDMSSIARDLVELRNVVAEEIHTVEACIDKVATLTTGHDSTPT